jgi:hypothetical protein
MELLREFWQNNDIRNISENTKHHVKRTLKYGSEPWKFKKRDREILEAAQMWIPRPLLGI